MHRSTSPRRRHRCDRTPRRAGWSSRDVGFRFADARQAGGPDLLRGFDLDLQPGETVALVGATGSGKTTLTAW